MARGRVNREQANEALDRLATDLDNLPAPEMVWMRDLLVERADLIRTLQQRGYTSAKVAELLTSHGLSISEGAVRSICAAMNLPFRGEPAPAPAGKVQKPASRTKPQVTQKPVAAVASKETPVEVDPKRPAGQNHDLFATASRAGGDTFATRTRPRID